MNIAYLKITETQLKKSIIDCTSPVRAMLKEKQFHNYEEQDQGLKTRKNLVYLDQPDNKNFETVSMYRPNTKKGDPRIWFTNLKQVVSQGDELGIFVLPNEPNVLFAFNRNDYAGFQDEILTELAVERLADIDSDILLDTSLCIECGTDTLKYGYVNRIPCGRTHIDAYVCGSCLVGLWEQEDLYLNGELVFCPMKDDDDPRYDEDGEERENHDEYERISCTLAEKWHETEHLPEIDVMFPDAPKFRELVSNEDNWTNKDKKTVQLLIANYSNIEPGSAT